MNLNTIRTRLEHWRHWELNPVVVKELRQAVRSWAVTGMLLLFLVVLFGVSLVFLIFESLETNLNQRLGADIFQAFTVVLTGASLLFIPLYIGVRLAAERQESNLDLLFITTLTPGRIIRGKFLCGAYVAVLFFSACMPFMVFTNLLRGIDLPTIFFILLCLFLVVCVAIQAAIFLACLPLSKLFKILLALGGTFFAFILIFPLISLFFEMMRSGIGSRLWGGHDFWLANSTGIGLLFAGALLLYFLSVALISPPSANRALPVRIFVTVLWLLGAGISLLWMARTREAWAMLPWAVISFIGLAVALVVVVSNTDHLSLRVRRAIPRGLLRRALVFPFYNGAAGGLVWCALLLVASFALSSLSLHQGPAWFAGVSTSSPEDRLNFEVVYASLVLYALAYALTALILHRRFLPKRTARLAGVLALLLPGAWAVLPNVGLFFINRLSWKMIESLQLGNMFNLFIVKDIQDKFLHLYFAGAWLVLMLILNARWFARQLKQFQPWEQTGASAESPPLAEPPVITGGMSALRE